MAITSVVGLDTAKNVFQLHGVNRDGKPTFKKRLRRAQLTDFFANYGIADIHNDEKRWPYFFDGESFCVLFRLVAGSHHRFVPAG